MYEIGSEFNFEKPSSREDLVEVFSEAAENAGKHAAFLRCGRDAIGFVADDILAGGFVNGDKKIYMPALCCDSMEKPFEVRGFDVYYYKVNKDLTIDEDYLFRMLDSDNDAPVVLVMNFFGTADVSKTEKAIKEKYESAVIIEDVTHILMEPEKYLGEGKSFADYHVGSIRKWLGVPDGALAIGKNEFLMGALTGETDFTSLRLEAMKKKSEYLDNGDADLKTQFRALLSDAEDSLNDGLDPYIMSDVSAEYLESIDAYTICEKRNRNYHNLYRMLKELPLCGKAFELLPEIEDEDVTPFMLPIVLDIDFMRRSAITDEGKNITRDGFEKLLAQDGVYAPVLWPISEEAAGVCENAKRFSENMLAFWIDQRYSRFDMERICEVLSGKLSEI